ncbi:MAG: carboxypeptidase regulatory-like domain-containing protein [bacterium]|nr:carboxypeptidase regulatory-like domain-containing protein [bacterium]
MKVNKKIFLLLVLFFSVFLIPFSFNVKDTEAGSTSSVNTTVKVGVCGNGIADNGEDCDNGDLQGETCTSLGYSGGDLVCDISCSFDTSSCTVPTIDSADTPPEDVTSILPAGYFTIPLTASIISTPSLTTTAELTINIPSSGGTSSIVLPQNTVITKSDETNLDPTTLTASSVTTSSLSGFSQGVTVDGALQWGISGTSLSFSELITLNIFVGTSLNGQTLNIVRSTSASSSWTSDGIVSPATCTVSAGLCSFQATKASYYATTRTISSSTNSLSSASAPSCDEIPPGLRPPWLYGARSQGPSSVLLYFTEAASPVDKYFLQYGLTSNNYQYGIQDLGINSQGPMTFLVGSLSPDTTYYFRIRGGHGCASGPWSNEISAKTKQSLPIRQLVITSSELIPQPSEKTAQPSDKTPAVHGYYVRVKVTDPNKNPIEGAKVIIQSKIQEVITNKDGIAEFRNIEAGDHKVIIVYHNSEGEQTVNLTGDVKEFDLNVSVRPQNILFTLPVLEITGALVLINLIFLIILIKTRKLIKIKRDH